jgi:superfamily II DNA or RNA helicase
MSRLPTLTYDRGTLILHPPPRGKAWIDFATWDDRVERFRIPAVAYAALRSALEAEGSLFEDKAKGFDALDLTPSWEMIPYPHQRQALAAWITAQHRGVVVLPTAAGKTYLAQLAMQSLGTSTLIVVPTLDLMHQWYAHLEAAFPHLTVGLLGGGSRDQTPLLVATYDSAAIRAEVIGNRYGLIIFDECHHLPSDFHRVIAEYAIAPYRLGLTATPERADNKHVELDQLIGPPVYRRSSADLAGQALADYQVIQIKAKLSLQERQRYQELIQTRNEFLREAGISLAGLEGWQHFIRVSSYSVQGRRAMLAHHAAKAIALGTDSKLRILSDLLGQHYPERVLIFTHDNATVYRISEDFLIPAITHQTPVKERHQILGRFRQGSYKTLVVANVLDEGVDVPDAGIAVVLAGSASTRQFIQRLGRVLRKGSTPNKQAILYEVIAEDTVEQRSSDRRRSGLTAASTQLTLVPLDHDQLPPPRRAAEAAGSWRSGDSLPNTGKALSDGAEFDRHQGSPPQP